MRRIFALIAVCLLGSLGCKHVGGKCDCGPSPGEATTYAPYSSPMKVVESVPAVKEMPKK